MSFHSFNFAMDDDVQALGVKCACFAMGGLSNRESDAEFDALAAAWIEKTLSATPLADILANPFLQGYRQLHTAVGFSNRNYIASTERLYQYLYKYGRLPQVNLLVDIYNFVSVENFLSLGAHDIAGVNGDVRLRLTDGSEGFWPIGSDQPKSVRPGAYAYTDEANDVICMMEVLQDQKSKATPETTECFYIVQGNVNTDQAQVQAAAERLVELNQRFLGGEVRRFY